MLTMRTDGTYVYMLGKKVQDDRLWRLENNGCLRVKKYPNYCLSSSGPGLALEHEILEKTQIWEYSNGLIRNGVEFN